MTYIHIPHTQFSWFDDTLMIFTVSFLIQFFTLHKLGLDELK